MLPPVVIEPGPIISSDSKPNTLLSGLSWYFLVGSKIETVGPLLAFACKAETLDPLYIHALLILTESSKSKNQVVHE